MNTIKNTFTLIVIGFILYGLYSATVHSNRAELAAEDEGYTEIVPTGAVFLGCGKEDSVFTSKHMTAKNENGKQVNLTVCCGFLFKGCTVRH